MHWQILVGTFFVYFITLSLHSTQPTGNTFSLSLPLATTVATTLIEDDCFFASYLRPHQSQIRNAIACHLALHQFLVSAQSLFTGSVGRGTVSCDCFERKAVLYSHSLPLLLWLAFYWMPTNAAEAVGITNHCWALYCERHVCQSQQSSLWNRSSNFQQS